MNLNPCQEGKKTDVIAIHYEIKSNFKFLHKSQIYAKTRVLVVGKEDVVFLWQKYKKRISNDS